MAQSRQLSAGLQTGRCGDAGTLGLACPCTPQKTTDVPATPSLLRPSLPAGPPLDFSSRHAERHGERGLPQPSTLPGGRQRRQRQRCPAGSGLAEFAECLKCCNSSFFDSAGYSRRARSSRSSSSGWARGWRLPSSRSWLQSRAAQTLTGIRWALACSTSARWVLPLPAIPPAASAAAGCEAGGSKWRWQPNGACRLATLHSLLTCLLACPPACSPCSSPAAARRMGSGARETCSPTAPCPCTPQPRRSTMGRPSSRA